MTLLSEIIDAASGNTHNTSSLLRKLKVLSARTETGLLAEWVNHELNGYPDAASLPAFRGPFEPQVLGHFVGPFNSEVINMPIAPMTFPEDMRDGRLFKVSLLDPIAEIEDLASQETIKVAWSADAVRYYNWGVNNGKIQSTVQEGMALLNAVAPMPRQIFVGVLDAVRNRALDLALELEGAAPQAGEPGAPDGDRETAQQIINNYTFHGANSNIAINSSHVTQTVELPKRHDEAGLIRYLAATGVPPKDLVRLEEALTEDRAEAGGVDPPQAGCRVRAWLAQTTTAVGSGAAGNLISAAITAFFGD